MADDLTAPEKPIIDVIPVENTEETKALTVHFHESLKDLDKSQGTNLSKTFAECQNFHNDNALVRANFQQMQVVFQNQMETWVLLRKQLSKKIQEMDPNDEDYTAIMKGYLDLLNQTTDMTLKVTRVIRDLKKEIRETELADRFFYHVSYIQQFMTGLKASLFMHLQTSPELPAVMKELKKLANIFKGVGMT